MPTSKNSLPALRTRALHRLRRITEARTFAREIGEGSGSGDTAAAPLTERFFAAGR